MIDDFLCGVYDAFGSPLDFVGRAQLERPLDGDVRIIAIPVPSAGGYFSDGGRDIFDVLGRDTLRELRLPIQAFQVVGGREFRRPTTAVGPEKTFEGDAADPDGRAKLSILKEHACLLDSLGGGVSVRLGSGLAL